jgi:hypothetical protein
MVTPDLSSLPAVEQAAIARQLLEDAWAAALTEICVAIVETTGRFDRVLIRETVFRNDDLYVKDEPWKIEMIWGPNGYADWNVIVEINERLGKTVTVAVEALRSTHRNPDRDLDEILVEIVDGEARLLEAPQYTD